MAELIDTFRGDNQGLIASINALLHLDSTNSLVPHGIGGHARVLLASAAVRLAAPPAQAVSVPEVVSMPMPNTGTYFPRCDHCGCLVTDHRPPQYSCPVTAATAAATREGKE